MKKILALVLAMCMVFALCACGAKTETPATGTDNKSAYKVAMITDYGDITDQSFNQSTYEGCKAFCEANSIDFSYYKPAGDSTAERVAMVDKAVGDGYNVIVMPGYAFAEAVLQVQDTYKDVKFIVLDVAKGDILAAALGDKYDYNPDNPQWNIDEYLRDNVSYSVYQEELCGYMAGYAAGKLGYTKLGFCGGMAVPAVVRYGYGFVQGADAAAAELKADVTINYAYANQFKGDADITAAMDTWYKGGTQCVFACGGGVYTSVCEAAKKADGKVIGVDNDQAGVIDAYADKMCVTSAMKGLSASVQDILKETTLNNNFADFGGKIQNLGLISGDDPTLNYVQIPMETTQWGDGFTQDNYKALVADMFSGKITVSNDISAKEPTATTAKVNFQGNLKG